MKAQEILLKKYGIPNADYQNVFCEIWPIKQEFTWFPADHFLVNKDLRIVATKAFKALEAKGLHTEIKTFDGCYNHRLVRGYENKPFNWDEDSLHDWAAAFDLNASLNPMHKNPTPEQRNGCWSKDFIITMITAGLFFGGDFENRADPMHWALYNG